LSRRYGRTYKAAVRLLPLDPHDDTPLDRALAAGLRGDCGQSYHGCNWCHDLPWRRRRAGCPGCGLPYAEEVIERAEAVIGTSYPVDEMEC
jgi:hypothetical protein